MYKELLKKIEEYDTIIIHRHLRPDGDALGSQIGLKEALKATYPMKRIFATGDVSQQYHFIGDMDEVEDHDYQDALVIIVDTGALALVSDERFNQGKYLIKIDHHASGTDYGDMNIVDKDEISCASLLAKIIFALDMNLTSNGARALFTGIITDSSRFKYQGVNTNTFLIASKLTAYNFSIQEIYDRLYIDDLDTVILRANFLLSMKQTIKKVAYIKSSFEDIIKLKKEIFSISRGMVNVMAGISGIDIWANFTECEDRTVLAELRSTKYDVSSVAVKYGGGGHKLASGATLSNFKEVDLMLVDLDKLIEEEK
jgi:phosphoesterase RecJ-like protein